MAWHHKIFALKFVLGSVILLLAACAIPPPPTPVPSPVPASPTSVPSPVRASPAPVSSPVAVSSPSPVSATTNCTLKFVSYLPMQGYSAPTTASMVNAIQLALEEHGTTTHDGKCNLVYATVDNVGAQVEKWNAPAQIELASRVAVDESILAVLGPYYSREAKIALPIFNRAGFLVMVSPSPASTFWGLTKTLNVGNPDPEGWYPTGIRNFARLVPTDDIEAVVAARWFKQQNVNKVFLVADHDLYSGGIALAFETEAAKLGLALAGKEFIDPEATDYTALVNTIKDSGAQSVYFAVISAEPTGKVLEQLHAANWNGHIFGMYGFVDTPFLASQGAAYEGTYMASAGIPLDTLKSTPASAKWQDAFRTKYNKPPEIFDAHAYEATNIVLAALDTCSAAATPTRACVRNAVFATKNWNGVLGDTWSFDANGDTTLTLESLYQVKNGKLEFVSIVK